MSRVRFVRGMARHRSPAAEHAGWPGNDAAPSPFQAASASTNADMLITHEPMEWTETIRANERATNPKSTPASNSTSEAIASSISTWQTTTPSRIHGSSNF
jgi:predicted protein tyrosine phosphatase